MKYLLAVSAEELEAPLGEPFEGIGLLRGEYICRKHEVYTTTPEWADLATNYITSMLHLYPDQQVWYRLTELETAEVNVLRGVDHIIDGEANPALGLRGMRRARRFPDAFRREAAVLAQIARTHRNLHLILPYVSSKEDVEFASRELIDIGYSNQLGMMVETPAAVLQLDFCIDAGISFALMGLNDLSSLTLGMDRGSPEISFCHPALRTMVKHVAATARKRGIASGVAGYFDHEFLKMAEEEGIEYAVLHYSLLARYLGPEYDQLPGQNQLWEIKQKTRDAIKQRLSKSSEKQGV